MLEGRRVYFPVPTSAEKRSMESPNSIADLMIVTEVADKCGRKDRLPEDFLARMIELKLRQNGIGVAQNGEPEKGAAILSARISVIGECTRCSFIVDLKVLPVKNTDSDPNIKSRSATWKNSLMGICSCPDLPNEAKKSLGQLLDDLMNDLRSSSIGSPAPVGP